MAYVIATGIDTAERARIERRLRDLVGRDALTGLIDRRRFEEELERHVAHGRRYGMTGALIVLDLNDFKAINEHHGHRAGDSVLVGVAEALTNRLRDTDLLARIGGDQFGVLLPQRQAAGGGARLPGARGRRSPRRCAPQATAAWRRAWASPPSAAQ